MRLDRTFARLAAILAIIAASPARGAEISDETLSGSVAEPNRRVASAFFAAGGVLKPEFEGADKYEFAPLVVANVKWSGVEFQLRGLQARIDLLADSALDFGPVVRHRGKRDDDVSGPVKRLAKIDGAIEGGGFVGYRFGGGADGQGEISVEASFLHDVSDTHDGFTVTGAVSYAALRWGRLYADVDLDVTYADKNFNRTYFGVTSAGSAASGLRAYRPGAGLKDVSAGLTAGYQIDDRWGVLVRAGVTRYVGDPADSPIVKQGSETAGLLGVGLTYRY